MPRKSSRETEKPYVLSKKDAWALLAAASNYMRAPERTVDGKERADILAEATLAKELSDLSDTISWIHSSVMRFHKGDYKAIQYLLETPAIRDDVKNEAKGTTFATAVERLFSPLRYFVELEDKLGERDIDWEKSAKVLLKVKAEKFPEDLTMVEKLTVAQSQDPAQRR
jgi:hypothetical protein